MAKALAKRQRDNLARSVLTVGGGRGFVVETEREDRFIITAGHTWERTYAKLVGPVGGEPTVWAECVFINPVDDLAVLAPPDNQALGDVAPAGAASSGKPA